MEGLGTGLAQASGSWGTRPAPPLQAVGRKASMPVVGSRRLGSFRPAAVPRQAGWPPGMLPVNAMRTRHHLLPLCRPLFCQGIQRRVLSCLWLDRRFLHGRVAGRAVLSRPGASQPVSGRLDGLRVCRAAAVSRGRSALYASLGRASLRGACLLCWAALLSASKLRLYGPRSIPPPHVPLPACP